MIIADQAARDAAVDPSRSFVVQAPAGSGKTGLLTQRFLRLLAVVERPEEIVAITFTRKAAAEMRQRLLESLEAGHGPAPEAEYARRSWELAREVLKRDRRAGWNLQTNPGRLRIGTIDSLCASLVGQMPVLSGLGGAANIAEKPEDLYSEAAAATLAMLEEPGPWAEPLEHLLTHLDNDLNRLHRLLVTMLGRREQWLPHSGGAWGREQLEACLRRLMVEELELVNEQLGLEAWPELSALLQYAASNLDPESGSPLLLWQNRAHKPGPVPEDLPAWRGVAELLLTRDGQWRKQFTKTIGFPTSAKKAEKEVCNAWKQRAESLLALLEDAQLAERLHEVASFPDWRYTDEQWKTLEALLFLLRVAAAQLLLVFGREGKVDFSEIAQRALQALGAPDEPSELAVSLDGRLSHLLVDEFQDTSLLQKRLLERLIADWQPGDGRTLFLVGDPMQSIYRFRNAEVRIFLEARQGRLGPVALEALTLSVNFRCQQGLVEWFNDTFSQVFPGQEDRVHGGVPYARADYARPRLEGPSVGLHVFESKAERGAGSNGSPAPAEAEQMTELIREARAADSAQTVAVLVRSRTHLVRLLPLLRQAGIDFSAVELENLDARPGVKDLVALTRSLLHFADRPAWLASLRAPWCGLSLADLHALTREAPTVWQALQDPAASERLTLEGRLRVKRLLLAMDAAFREQGRVSLRRWVETCWMALGGPACCSSEAELEDAEVFFQLLEQLDQGGDVRRLEDLESRLQQLYAVADPNASGLVQLMTIHKSKGLEFDVVLLPGLAKRARGDDTRLFVWMERPRAEGSDLLLAPIRSANEEADPTYNLLQRLEQKKARHEDARLLYVAATRARKRLHLLFELAMDERKGVWKTPDQSCLLARLWPQLEAGLDVPVRDFVADGVVLTEQDLTPEIVQPRVPLLRLPADWAASPLAELPAPEPLAAPYDFSAGDPHGTRRIGMIVQAILQRVAIEGIPAWSPARLERCRAWVEACLVRLEDTAREDATAQVLQAVRRTLEDPKGRWLLSSERRQASCELGIRGILEGKLKEIVIDRTFFDEQGVRWIVDYSTADENTLAAHREQLVEAARMFQRLEGRPPRAALYFPFGHGWDEMDLPHLPPLAPVKSWRQLRTTGEAGSKRAIRPAK
jgi:ATP-dependent helicase/nuclease subunit A